MKKKKIFYCLLFLLTVTLSFSGCGLLAANARLFAEEPIITSQNNCINRYQLPNAAFTFLYPKNYIMETQIENATIVLYPPDRKETKDISAALTIVSHNEKLTIQDHLDKAVQKLKDNINGLEIVEQKIISEKKGLISITSTVENTKRIEKYTYTLLENHLLVICGITAPEKDYQNYQEDLELILNSPDTYESTAS